MKLTQLFQHSEPCQHSGNDNEGDFRAFDRTIEARTRMERPDENALKSSGGVKRQWTSRFTFLMASIGAAVGLGNLWRFPFQTGQSGGAAFVLVYLVCVAVVVYPVMMGELAIGRHKGLSAVGSTAGLARDSGRSPLWGLVGLVGVFATYFVLTIYGVIAGKVMAYSAIGFLGGFSDGAIDGSLYEGPLRAFVWQSLFMLITILIVARGLHAGIERYTSILMPVFFVMLAGLSVYALATGATAKALDYLFTPRFSEITPEVVLAALGQAFFSLAVGGAAMLTYGAFLPTENNIVGDGAIIAASDTLVAVIAGLMIFPVVFAFNLDPGAGMGLIFQALPVAFSHMPFGSVIGGMFFFLAFIAALTSSISMLMLASVVGEEQLGLGRLASVIVLGAVAWAIGGASIIVPHLSEWIDFAAGSVAMPLGGLLVAIFAGWVAPRAIMRGELGPLGDRMFRLWRLIVRYLAPIAVLVIMAMGLDAKLNFGLSAVIAKLIGG
jgi:NSS family neurotransmitter:Na+ symporter